MMVRHTEQMKAADAGKGVRSAGAKRTVTPRFKTKASDRHRADQGAGVSGPVVSKDVENLVDEVRHAYLRLIAGDSVDARRALENALGASAIEGVGCDARNATRVADSNAHNPLRVLGEPGTARVAIRTLGTFELLVDGAHPGSPRKPAQRPLGMLKVLIAHGGCAVSEGVLVDALWPDLDGDHAHDARQVALHRLRKLLGSGDAVAVSDGRMFIDDEQVWVDAFALETVCRNASLGGSFERAHVALDLYKGAFLPQDVDAQWSGRMRECLRAKFVNIVARAATELESRSEFVRAASLFERGHAVDDLDDVLREGMVRCLKKTGAGGVSQKKK